MGMIRTVEFWQTIKKAVEGGLSLQRAARQFGVSRSHLCRKAEVENWQFAGRGLIGRPKVFAGPDEKRREQMRREQARQAEAREALMQESRVLVLDVQRAELVTQKVLRSHSTQLKTLLSEWAVRTAERLCASEGRLRDDAAAMLAIKAIGKELYGWDRESDVQGMQLARTSNHSQVKSYYEHWRDGTIPPEMPQSLVNPALIATTPQQLAEMAKAKFDQDDHSGDRFSKDSGPSATECNAQGMGPSAIAPERSPAASPGCSVPKKAAPPGSVNEPAPASRTVTRGRAASLLAPEQPVHTRPFPDAKATFERPEPSIGRLAG